VAGVGGLLLAAGAGRRMGRPKALVGDWLAGGVRALADGGCARVVVVLGAAAGEAAPLLRGTGVGVDVDTVLAEDWQRGMSASLGAGLGRLEQLDPAESCRAALVLLVDLPDVGPAVVRRVIGEGGEGTAVLARATYGGRQGHPVLLGRDHWPGIRASARGDVGARDYLAGRDPVLVECGDLATGEDRDRP
jgi:molybdenum cofactor cytidylyltransferase/nicotine blue oxidoreductase